MATDPTRREVERGRAIMRAYETELQGHMQRRGNDTTPGALCGHPHAYIVDIPFGIEAGDDDGVTCGNCGRMIRELRALAGLDGIAGIAEN